MTMTPLQLAQQHSEMVGGLGELARAFLHAHDALQETNRYNRRHNDFENLFRSETPADRVLRFADRYNRAANAARWRLCWLCRWAVLRGGGPFVVQLAERIGRDTDSVYKMAQACQLYLELYAYIQRRHRDDAVYCQYALSRLRRTRHVLTWSHFAAEAGPLFRGQTEPQSVIEDLRVAAETGASVRSMAGHTSNRLSLVLPLWTAQTVTDYLARVNGSGAAVKFVACEGPAWDDVEQVVVRPEKKT